MLEKLTTHGTAPHADSAIAAIHKALLEREGDAGTARDTHEGSGGEAAYGQVECTEERDEEALFAADGPVVTPFPVDHSTDSWGRLQDEMDVLLSLGELSPQDEERLRELHDVLEKALGAHDIDGGSMASLLAPEQQKEFEALDTELALLYERGVTSAEDEERMDMLLARMDALLSQLS